MTNTITPDIPHSFFLQLYVLSTIPYGLGYSLGQLSCLCPPPAPCTHAAHSLVGGGEMQKKP